MKNTTRLNRTETRQMEADLAYLGLNLEPSMFSKYNAGIFNDRVKLIGEIMKMSDAVDADKLKAVANEGGNTKLCAIRGALQLIATVSK